MLALAPISLELPKLGATAVRLEKQLAPGRVGVAVWDLKSGKRWGYRDHERFPMQSSFKFPLGVAFLAQVDRGKASLDERVRIDGKSLSVSYSEINDLVLAKGPQTYTCRQLLEMAVGKSDNTATDVLMKRLGGPKGVQRILNGHSIGDIRVNRYEHDLQPEYSGFAGFRPEMRTDAGFEKLLKSAPKAKVQAVLRRYLADLRDTATPYGMAQLLWRIDRGQILSPQSRKLLLDIMTASTTGADRLRAGIPAGAKLAHKTGTGREVYGIRGAMVDVGIITLPTGRKVIVAVMLKGVGGSDAQRAGAISEIARIAANR